MNAKLLGYITGVINVAWSIYLISTGSIVMSIVFFVLGCVVLKMADNL